MQKDRQTLPPLQYNIQQLMEVLSMGKTKIRALIDAGDLPSYRVGGSVFVSVADVEKFIEKHREKAIRAVNPGFFQVTENN